MQHSITLRVWRFILDVNWGLDSIGLWLLYYIATKRERSDRHSKSVRRFAVLCHGFTTNGIKKINTDSESDVGIVKDSSMRLGTPEQAGTKLEQRLDKLDSKVDGWVKWAVRFGIGGILVGFGLVFESRNHMDKKFDIFQATIAKSIKDSEERLETKIKDQRF
ncbi:uncharacterized protein H6S33_009970 [Morchella sextelata]|uniref:uncharacterized protein n=1 Tax=Morchella sextelata TaxID=1174677 RepID=UPI001D037BF4|nr:uncharacterized protein H6S33_009970 [Morchella sextelata]KAH0611918.1 hypothetical protein H6S33_009970 [Morchella sextelata]